MDRSRLLLVLLVVMLAAAAISCSARSEAAPRLPHVSDADGTAGASAAVPSFSVALEPTAGADEGLPLLLAGRVDGPQSLWPRSVELQAGGERMVAAVEPDGSFRARWDRPQPGEQRVAVEATAGDGRVMTAETTLSVRERAIVFVQGMNSYSECPNGGGFFSRAPEWVAELDDAGAPGLGSPRFAYFSYSGQYCDGGNGANGAAADYSDGDTCQAIAGESAVRLRALIDALAPARVTVLAYSMGGLVTASMIADDPDWAREHIASVITFDSPLQGIDGVRSTVFGVYSLFDDGCGRGSDAMDDLRGGSDVVEAAAGAAHVVPFYTLDGTQDEKRTFGLAEAVPGGRTSLDGAVAHLSLSESHSESWNDAPEGSTSAKARLVVCALQREPASMCGF